MGQELRTEENTVASFDVNADASPVDWRDHGAVTAVKDQGQCGSCWSFSTTGALEGAHVIAGGALTAFSESQFVDCDYGLLKNMGCNGGLMDKAFKYAEKSAIATEEAYPYVAKKNSCDSSKLSGATLKVSSYEDVKKNDVDAMKAMLAKGPVSVAIEADQKDFQTYTSGVLCVGWGSENDQEFWIVKNSWGPSWGDAGYIKLAIASDAAEGTCGILSGPPSQPVTN